MKSETVHLKPLVWIGRSKKDLSAFPEAVKDVFGYGLYLTQTGGKHADAKPLKGFGGAGVLEIVDDHDGNTYRAVYTVRMKEVYLCPSCVPKEINQRHRDAQGRYRSHPSAAEAGTVAL